MLQLREVECRAGCQMRIMRDFDAPHGRDA